MRKVLCIGNSAYDMTIMMNGYPDENAKYRVDGMVKCPGGSASNAAYLLGKWNIDTYFAGMVGDDLYGKFIMDDFRKVNVKTKYVSVDMDNDTPISVVLVNKENGSRTVLSCREKKIKMDRMNYEEDFDYILADGREYEETKRVFLKYPKAIKVMDVGSTDENDMELAGMVDYLVCPLSFASYVVGYDITVDDKKGLIDAYKKIEKKFGNKLVITLGEHGSIYRDEKGIRLMPSYHMKRVMDTTGAGDIFHGAFVYGLIKGYKYEDVIRIATIASALSVRKIGGRNSIVSIDEVMLLYGKSR